MFLLFISPSTCQMDGEPWTDITSSDTYKKQPPCIQSCLLDVVNQIPGCVDYGCVCTGDALGSNFLAGFNNIFACAQRSCGDSTDANNAENAFRDICLIQQGIISVSSSANTPARIVSPTGTTFSNSTVTISFTTGGITTGTSSTSAASQPTQTVAYLLLINSTFYDTLNECSKFCLNSCRDPSGVVNEPDCNTDKKPQGWNLYYGVSYQLECTTPSCLCAGGAFNLTYGTLWKESMIYCNYLPTLADLPDPEYDRMQGVLADYCGANGYPPRVYKQIVSGSPNNSALTPPILSTSDKIAIGIGLPSVLTAILGVVIAGYQTWFAYKKYKGEKAKSKGRGP